MNSPTRQLVNWTGSLGSNKDGEYKSARNTLFTTKVTGSGATTALSYGGSYKKLRDDLVPWDEAHGDRYGFAAGTADGQAPKQIDGFNVEGLEFAPGSTTTAYVGFRAPLAPAVPGGKALLVPVTNIDKVVRPLHLGRQPRPHPHQDPRPPDLRPRRLGGRHRRPRPHHPRRPSPTPHRQRLRRPLRRRHRGQGLTHPEWKKSRGTWFTVTG